MVSEIKKGNYIYAPPIKLSFRPKEYEVDEGVRKIRDFSVYPYEITLMERIFA